MRKVSVWLIIVVATLSLALWIPDRVIAEEPVLTVAPGDSPLVIRGTLDGQTTAFSGNVRLTVTISDVTELRFLPSDVHHAGDTTVAIDRSNVTIPAGMGLSNGQPRDVRVTVNNVTRPGDYSGELKFLLPGQTEDKALVIKLMMHIDAKPKVQPVQPNMSFQVVRCQTPIDCAIATWLLPDSVVREDWTVHLDNQTLAAAEITDATVVMRGDKTGNAVPPGDINLGVPHILPASKVEPISLTIHRNRLSPDRYQGTLRFKLKGTDDPVTVNVDLNVRDGPVWPLLVVLMGIIVGRLARGMETQEAQKQVKLLPRFYQARADADKVQNAPAKTYLTKLLQDVKSKIEAATETEEALLQALERLQARIDLLVNLEELESQLVKLGLDALNAELKPKIQAARRALLDEKVEEAERLRGEVEARLRDAQKDGTMGAAADLFEVLLNVFHDNGVKLVAAEEAEPPTRPGGDRWGWLARLVAMLSGAKVIGAEVRYWLIRPLLFTILLVGLALLGLQTLYVNAGSTFGADGLYDYLGLFLWGLSADVAQRILQSLQLSK